MVIGLKERVLSILAYRYWTRNNNRSSEENWKKAEKLLNYIEKRTNLIERIIKSER